MRYIIVLLLINLCAFADDEQVNNYYFFDPIVVTANRFETHLDNTSRHVTVISADEISQSTSTTVSDLLSKISGIHVQSRGAMGVQADIQLRGASSEGLLILIDGARMNDPQTSHHHFNLPISLQNIERIEILHGGASAVYGANAVGGVINIITKNRNNLTNANLTGGENGLVQMEASVGYSHHQFSHQLSATRTHSDGFTDYTEFDQRNVFYKTSWKKKHSSITGWLGYTDKKFEANSFYSTAFPNEWEHTTALSAYTSGNFTRGRINFSPILSWRQHDDDFILDNARPDWYRNTHRTHIYTLQMPWLWSTTFGDLFLNQDIRIEQINSNSLGDHHRQNYGFNAAFKKSFAHKYNLSIAQHVEYFDKWGWKSWQQIDAGVRLHAFHYMFGSFSSAYRMPTFTEMYYNSPANIGNPNLSYEKFINFELGYRLTSQHFMGTITLFNRQGNNMIDWVRFADQPPWQVENIGQADANGIEIDATLLLQNAFMQHLRLSYSGLQMQRNDADFESKYVFAYLRNHAGLEAKLNTLFHTQTSLSVHYYERVNLPAYVLTDASIKKSIGNWTVGLYASNVFNQTYNEISKVPMPGRWLRMSVAKSWFAGKE